jgi:hypothetical protein
MTQLTAQSITPAVRAWLRYARRARILHIFDRAVNLIAGPDVLSFVTPEIGDGPFNVVLPSCNFAQQITLSDPLRIAPNGLHIGDLIIDLSSATLWHPYPDWQHLRLQRARVRAQAPIIRAVLQRYAPANSLAHVVVDLPTPPSSLEAHFVNATRLHWHDLYQGALNLDYGVCAASAEQLVGLGSGLTPAGDDWLLGCALAAHLDLPSPTAAALILNAVRLAASSTNPLSSCWLRAAVNGACSRYWHTFFAGCLGGDSRAVYRAAFHIVRQGHSSGADALAGYFALLVSV